MVRHRGRGLRHRRTLPGHVQHQPLLGRQPDYLPRLGKQHKRTGLHRRQRQPFPPVRRCRRHQQLAEHRHELQRGQWRDTAHRGRRDVFTHRPRHPQTAGTPIPICQRPHIRTLELRGSRPWSQPPRRFPCGMEARLVQLPRLPTQFLIQHQQFHIGQHRRDVRSKGGRRDKRVRRPDQQQSEPFRLPRQII